MAWASTLFVSPRSPSRAISKNAISYFLQEVISGDGAVRGDEGPPLRAHSIRRVSTSAAFLQNWLVSKVMDAATWKSNSVFASFYFKDIRAATWKSNSVCASFYFKDIQCVFEVLRSLGPFVAVGSVVNPT